MYIRNLLDLVTIFTDILRVTSVRVNCLVMVTHSKTKMEDFFKKAKLLPQPFRPKRQRAVFSLWFSWRETAKEKGSKIRTLKTRDFNMTSQSSTVPTSTTAPTASTDDIANDGDGLTRVLKQPKSQGTLGVQLQGASGDGR